MENKIQSLSGRQTEYALRRYRCIPVLNADGTEVEGTLQVKVEKPFLLLDTIVVDESLSTDRDSFLSQGVDNSLQYIAQHPIINILLVANCSAFHNSPNVYYVEDLRESPIDSQYVFVLICTNY